MTNKIRPKSNQLIQAKEKCEKNICNSGQEQRNESVHMQLTHPGDESLRLRHYGGDASEEDFVLILRHRGQSP